MNDIYFFGPFLLNPTERSLQRDGENLKLSSAEYSLLLVLVQRAGEVIDRDTLIQHIWGKAQMAPNSLAQSVSRLRKKLGSKADGKHYIETVHNQGYCLTEAVRTSPA